MKQSMFFIAGKQKNICGNYDTSKTWSEVWAFPGKIPSATSKRRVGRYKFAIKINQM